MAGRRQDPRVVYVNSEPAPILFAYDGSDQAKAAIEYAGRELPHERPAIVLTVWEPLTAVALGGVALISQTEFDAEIGEEAAHVAEGGRSLAQDAGFRATSRVRRGSPVWKEIVDAAEEAQAELIVAGSHGRSGVTGVLLGSVAQAVSRHCHLAVLIVH